MKKLTQVKRMQAYMAASMHQVMELLEWDMQLYCNFKYECGRAYLEAYIKGDPAAIRQLEESIAYWGWWKLHWYLREQEFLSMQERKYRKGFGAWPLDNLREQFDIINDGDILAKAITHRGKLLEESYCSKLVPMLKSAGSGSREPE